MDSSFLPGFLMNNQDNNRGEAGETGGELWKEIDFGEPSSCIAIAKLVLDRSITIQDVVAETGKYLTATDNSIRATGILFLGELMVKLALMPLEDVTIQSLSKFFTSRLADWPCLRGALVGCIALLKRSTQDGAVQEREVKLMMKSVLENLHVQALGVNDRLLCLELFECLLHIHRLSVVSMGGDLVYGVCAAIEEEKDPRCLLVAFRLVEDLADLYPESDGPLADCAGISLTLLAAISLCPSLRVPAAPNDPRGISRDDLVGALLKVFTSTPLFAPFCVPFLLEKLSSSLRIAKLDSLRYLGSCALSFQSQSISGYTSAIWLALKAELIPPSAPASSVTTAQDHKDAEIHEEALICLTRCVETLQRGVEKAGSLVASDLLNLICEDECVEDLLRCVENDIGGVSGNQRVSDGCRSTESKSGSNILTTRVSKQTQATGQMLAAVLKASPSSCYFVMDKLLQRLITAAGMHSLGLSENVLNKNTSATIKKQLHMGSLSSHGLEVIVLMLDGASTVAGKMVLESTEPITKTWLQPVVSAVPILLAVFSELIICQSLINDQSKFGVAGLQALAYFPAALSPLSEKHLHHVLSILVEILLDDTNADLKGMSLKAILAISNQEEKFMPHSETRDSMVLVVVTQKLLEAVEQSQSSVSLKTHLQALAAIASPRQITRQAVLNGFRQIVGTAFQEALVEVHHDNASQKVVTILDCLSQEIIPFCKKDSTDQMVACDIILDIWSAIQSVPVTTVQMPDELLSALMAVNRITICGCQEALQEKIVSVATSVLLDSPKQESEQDSATILRQNKGSLAALVASVVVGLLPAVVSPKQGLVLRIFVNSSIFEAGSIISNAAAQATASLLNKWKITPTGKGNCEQAGDTLEEAISNVIDGSLLPVIDEYRNAGGIDSAGNDLHNDQAVKCVYALAWTGKGLAMRGHSRISDVATELLMLLQSEGIKVATTSSCVDELDAGETMDQLSPLQQLRALGIIMKDNPACLNMAHNAVIRPLYKQRFFTSMLPPLIEAVRMAGSRLYRIFLFRGFGHLLSGTPLAAVLTEGQKVFPLVLEGLSVLCLHSEDSDLLLSTLLALSAFLVDENNGRIIAENYVPAVVKRLVTLVQYRPSSIYDPAKASLKPSRRSISLMVIRETALQCLGAIIGLPFVLVFPVKQQVMKAVIGALDDHKRSVRKEAVSCRRVWGPFRQSSMQVVRCCTVL